MLNLRRLSVVLLLLATLSPLSSPAEKVSTMPAPTGYINDYAGVLTAPAKSELEDLCRDLHDKTRAQLFVVTIKTLDGESVETFANQLFHKWKIGEKKTDRGLLVLLAIDDHQRRIEVGTGFEGLINDAKAGDIGREMVPNLKAADYDGAVKIGVDRLAQIVAADSNVTLDALTAQPDSQTAPAPLAESEPPTHGSGAAFAVIGFMLFSFVAAISFFVWRIRRAVKAGTFHPMRSSGGSSSSDDSSSDSSSSDDSFSGGDGGDSDGGGSSGSW
jgi:uncharacterized protein